MRAPISTYRPSMGFRIGYFPAAPFAIFPTAVVGGWLYNFLATTFPIFGIVTVVLCVAYTSVLASVHASALTKHHVRNPILSAAGGFATGAIGLYTSWAAFLSLMPTAPSRLGDIGYLGYLASPTAIAEGIRATSESGWYSIFGWEVSGSLWLGSVGVEAVFIVVGSTAIALDASSKVYCEACDRWCDTETNAIDFLDAESFLEALEEIVLGNMRAVATIPVVPDLGCAARLYRHHFVPDMRWHSSDVARHHRTGERPL